MTTETEMTTFPIREPSLEALREAPIYFRYKSNKQRVLVDALTARAILACYDALKEPESKVKFERMVAESTVTLDRLVGFCWKHVRLK